MVIGQWLDALIDINVDADLTAEVDLGRPYEKLLLICPALSVSATVGIQVAEKSGGTFYALHKSQTNGATTLWATTAYTTGVFATVCECLGGFQFIKIALSADQTAANVTFRVCGIRS